MDGGGFGFDEENGFEDLPSPRPRTLPADLPRSLDDRQPVRQLANETEYYDGWQGM